MARKRTARVDPELMKAWVRDRDTALLKGSPQAFIDLYAKWKLPLPDPKTAEVAMHKTITATEALPMRLRSKSKKWLLRRGFTPLDLDDSVPPYISGPKI